MEKISPQQLAATPTVTDSWGNIFKPAQQNLPVSWRTDDIRWPDSTLAIGNRRSYGDVCINDSGYVIDTTSLNRVIAFDRNAGVIRCEAGVTLWQLIEIIVAAGWFLPVTPGTGYVTVGGAVANDVHGKNHHSVGSFGCFVEALAVKRSDGEELVCDRENHAELFAATIGGLGLTGLITWVQIKLSPIKSTGMVVESCEYHSLDEFLSISATEELEKDYCVAWLDCLSNNASGVFFGANHSSTGELSHTFGKSVRSVPKIVGAGFPLVNWVTLVAFNRAYQFKHSGKNSYTESMAKFFYPLDSVRNWNRIYGRRGFYQFQCVVPHDNASALNEVLTRIKNARQGSFLSVLKTMGSIKSPGMLSFCRPGITLALDFPNRGQRTVNLLRDLESVVMDAEGAIYPAKDAVMSAQTFQRSFPALDKFIPHIDPKFTSSFWRRVCSN